ncbi:hypothetical protein LSH36_191g02039 [Paralvinella palmiformis]|uniref:Uncharacterized protein n=1 Tax=Paralvinella palmiformis TaxID=53620 RepID=A0AAD9N6M9_9ANNE|nr:hypothetical protein LSH36_191g02039 [Paralvinella palmiformis]
MVFISLITYCGVLSNDCIFSTILNLKSSNNSVTESHIVKDFYNDCEFLSYRNPTKCEAANIVVRDDSTCWRKFVLLNTTRNKLFVLVPYQNGNIYHGAQVGNNLELLFISYLLKIIECNLP